MSDTIECFTVVTSIDGRTFLSQACDRETAVTQAEDERWSCQTRAPDAIVTMVPVGDLSLSDIQDAAGFDSIGTTGPPQASIRLELVEVISTRTWRGLPIEPRDGGR